MPFMLIPDWTFLLLIPALILAVWAQYKVKSTYERFSEVGNRRGLTGADVAARILRDAGIEPAHGRGGQGTVGIEPIAGNLTDHYDPRSHMLRLSEGVYNGRSVAALGIAAHEVGHAIQHARAYSPLMLRNLIYPVTSLGSTLAFPLFFVGFFVNPALGQTLMTAAIILFSLAVFFTVLTLPVEFNASSRALRCLSDGGYLSQDELQGARKVLQAAAMTYVAAAAMAILQLVRMILLANRR